MKAPQVCLMCCQGYNLLIQSATLARDYFFMQLRKQHSVLALCFQPPGSGPLGSGWNQAFVLNSSVNSVCKVSLGSHQLPAVLRSTMGPWAAGCQHQPCWQGCFPWSLLLLLLAAAVFLGAKVDPHITAEASCCLSVAAA